MAQTERAEVEARKEAKDRLERCVSETLGYLEATYKLPQLQILDMIDNAADAALRYWREQVIQGPKKKLCRLGYCATKKSHYAGGNQKLFDQIKNGECPICGGKLQQ